MSFRKIPALVLIACLLLATLSGCVAEGGGTEGGGVQSIIMLVAVVGIFYFFAIRPESKRKKKAQEMRNSISAGDNIVTIGGIIGKVVFVSDDKITYETGADRVRVEAMKWCVSDNRGRGASEKLESSEETLEGKE